MFSLSNRHMSRGGAASGTKRILTRGHGGQLSPLAGGMPALEFGLTLLGADTYNPNSLTDCVLEFMA